jgi:hypothetical protein
VKPCVYGAAVHLQYLKNSVTCIPIAKQWLSKQASNNRVTVFCGVSATTIGMQWFGKHASTIEAVFSAWSVRRIYLENNRRYKAVEGSVVEC